MLMEDDIRDASGNQPLNEDEHQDQFQNEYHQVLMLTHDHEGCLSKQPIIPSNINSLLKFEQFCD
jgi:hypothetical protein